MMFAPKSHLPLALLAGMLAAVGCDASNDDAFDKGAFGEPDSNVTGASLDDQAPDDDTDAEPEPAADEDPEPETFAFAHAGTFVGTCTFADREPFQVDIDLNKGGRGFIRRHDVGLVELDAAGRTDAEGVSAIEAMRDGIIFRVQLYPESEGLAAECFELEPTDGEGNSAGMGCMFDSTGCNTTLPYEIVASGELELIRTS